MADDDKKGIEESLVFLQNMEKLGMEVIKLMDEGIGWDSIGQVAIVLGAASLLVKEAKKVLPELDDLDPDEVGELSKAAYVTIKRLVDAA